MRVAAFRIRNFRSIVDTGWVDLSPDGITALVGQNEAGKTSVLRAIDAFKHGAITPDDQRSDGSLPEVYLSFELDAPPSTMFNNLALPDGFDKEVKDWGMRVRMLRIWNAQLEAIDPMLDPEQDLAELFPEDEADEDGHPLEPTTAPAFAMELFDHAPDFALFSDEASLLPDRIDLAQVQATESDAEGIQAVRNFITVAGLTVADLGDPAKQRIEDRRLRDASKRITDDFQSFWEQTVGRENKVSFKCVLKRHHEDGHPYLEFLVNDNREELHLRQRSKGLQWFLSFYLQLQANAKQNDVYTERTFFLIDEPGGSLHAKAQENVLRVLEDLKNRIQVLYTTHSPFLINIEELGRLLIAERSDDEDESSPTIVKDVHRFTGDDEAALFPVYAAIGADLSHQRLVERADNVLLEEISAYHYLRAFRKLTGEKSKAHLIPGSGANTTAPMFANLFTGWGLGYIVLVDNDEAGKRAIRSIKKHLFQGRDDLAGNDLLMLPVGTIEDVLTLDDFKRWVLNDATLDYTESNGDYMKGKAKALHAAQFYAAVEKDEITAKDFSPESMASMTTVVRSIADALKAQRARRG